jgi:hypothetical protein
MGFPFVSWLGVTHGCPLKVAIGRGHFSIVMAGTSVP